MRSAARAGRPLPARTEAALRGAAPSIPAGLSLEDPVPPGFRRLDRSAVLERRDLDAVAAELFSWQLHLRAGLGVRASDTPLGLGAVLELRLGPGPFSLRAPCRVVEIIEQPNRRGFTYATLPGHPESGLERFLLEQGADGRVRLTLSAVSAPASLPARLARPRADAVQERITRRYLRALEG